MQPTLFQSTGAIQAATIATVFQGGIMMPASSVNPGSQASSAPWTANNQIQAVQVVVPFSIAVGHIAYDVTTAGTGGGPLIDMGLYDAAGANLLVHIGATAAGALGAFRPAIAGGGTVNIPAGVYWYATTSNDSTVQMEVANVGRSADVLNAGATKLCGVSGTSSAGGVLPAALGVITGLQINFVLSYFQV